MPGGEEVEILIVDDGSKDRTAEIADRLEKEHSGIVRAIHQENGGHGEAVNTGIANATGKYFKVVDSDDWVNESAYQQILNLIRRVVEEEQELDVLFSNFVYEKEGATRKKVMHYHHALPIGEFFTWEDVKSFRVGHYILMHSVIYRTELLRECGLKLPKHTFYVDNIYVYYPLPHVRTIYYLDVNLYRYYIGRDDQSVNEKNMIKRIDQQLYVNQSMIDMYQMKMISNKKLRSYMIKYLAIMMTVSSIICIRSKKEENLKKKKELWIYLKRKDYKTYFKIRYGILGQTMNLPGRSGRKISSMGYSVMRRIIGFN